MTEQAVKSGWNRVTNWDRSPTAKTSFSASSASFSWLIAIQSDGTTYQTGQDTVVRAQFINNGALANTLDTNFRAVSDDWPVFAFAKNLGTFSSAATTPVIFSVGHVRDPAAEYIVANGGTQSRSLYFWSQFSTVSAAISSFLGDYDGALSRAQALDSKIQGDANAISSDYASIVALSVRQALGATEITISKDSSGGFNTDDVLVFMKGKPK